MIASFHGRAVPASQEAPNSQDIWAGRVAAAWAAVMLATELKTSIPYIHWAVSALSLILTMSYVRNACRGLRFPAQIPAVLFACSVCVPVLCGARVLYSFAEAVKLLLILLGGLSIFVARPYLAHFAFRGFLLVACVNVALLLGGCFGLGGAEEMALYRWGTFLSWPGSLWRVAMSVWVFAAYTSVKGHSLLSFLLLLGSTWLVFMDGTRTGILLLLMAAGYVILILAEQGGRVVRMTTVAALALGLGLLLARHSGAAFETDAEQEGGAAIRVSRLLQSTQNGGIEGLGGADAIRFQMLQDAAAAIQAHPLLGTGIETTVTETIVGPMGVHMTYLQVWADLGVVGLVAYTWLVWGWAGWVPRFFRGVRRLSDPFQKAVYYNALYGLLWFALSGLLHPLSTEWSEWVVFIISYALVWEIAVSKQPRWILAPARTSQHS